MIKNPCDIPLHKLICKDFGPHSGFGHCSLNNKSIHWFNQPPNWKYSEPSFVKSCSRRTDGTTVRHTNHPHKTKQPTQKPPPEQKTHNQETCTCITWETLLWREALNFLKAIPSKLEDGANILWRRGDEPFNFHRVSFFVIWCVGDHSYGIYCCMICVLLCTPCRIQKKNVAIQLLCLCPTNCTRMDSIIVFLLTCVLGGDCWESHSWYIMIHMYISINICVYLHIHLCIYQRLRFRGIFGRFLFLHVGLKKKHIQ